MQNQYSYLFKYIIIGDASKNIIYVRCRKIMHSYAVSLKQIQNRFRNYCWSVVWLQSHRNSTIKDKIANMGHSICMLIF